MPSNITTLSACSTLSGRLTLLPFAAARRGQGTDREIPRAKMARCSQLSFFRVGRTCPHACHMAPVDQVPDERLHRRHALGTRQHVLCVEMLCSRSVPGPELRCPSSLRHGHDPCTTAEAQAESHHQCFSFGPRRRVRKHEWYRASYRVPILV
jgi:hypothetical protein